MSLTPIKEVSYFGAAPKRTLKIRQRRLSRTKRGSQNRKRHIARVASVHNKIVNRRNAHQWQTANKLVKKADAVVVENLNIKGMVKQCQPKTDGNTGRFLPNGQAARNIKHKAVVEHGLTLIKVRQDLAKPKQLTLFETLLR